MASWQSLKAARYPALFILHIAFAWMPAALILNGVAIIFPAQFPPLAALHAMTMGAMGTMIAAFMMRSASVRNGERLILSRPTTCAFRLLSVSALLRVFGDGMSAAYFEPVCRRGGLLDGRVGSLHDGLCSGDEPSCAQTGL